MLPLLPDNQDFVQPKCTVHESSLAGARALVLDNSIFRLSILPEYGGRLCSLFYRPANLELLATDFINGPRKTMNVHGGWCAAFPSLLADGEIISRQPWEAEIMELTDQQVTARLWCMVQQVSHMIEGKLRVTPGTIVVERFVRMVAGEAAVTVEDVLTNRNAWPMSTTWSAMVALKAQPGDRAVLPVENVEVQNGVGPSGNELDFGLLVTTPYQAFARQVSEGWVGFCPAMAPIDIRINFPKDILPHVVVSANRKTAPGGEGSFRLQPIATDRPIAADTRDGALILPPKLPVRIPIRLEAGASTVPAGTWNRPGLQLAEMITEQRVPSGRVAVWRVGECSIAIKTPRQLLLLMPEFGEETLLSPMDLPAANLIVCEELPDVASLRAITQRTAARLVGPASIRQQLLADGVGDDRSVALSPGARFDLPGLGLLATPSRHDGNAERLGYLLQADHLLLYHTGRTQFLGEFGAVGTQFSPQLVFLPVGGAMTMADCIHAAKQLQPRVVVPLGTEAAESEFIKRCRDQHLSFAAQSLNQAEGRFFDGWHLNPLA